MKTQTLSLTIICLTLSLTACQHRQANQREYLSPTTNHYVQGATEITPNSITSSPQFIKYAQLKELITEDFNTPNTLIIEEGSLFTLDELQHSSSNQLQIPTFKPEPNQSIPTYEPAQDEISPMPVKRVSTKQRSDAIR